MICNPILKIVGVPDVEISGWILHELDSLSPAADDLILAFLLIFEKRSWKHLPAVDRANKIDAEQQKNPG